MDHKHLEDPLASPSPPSSPFLVEQVQGNFHAIPVIDMKDSTSPDFTVRHSLDLVATDILMTNDPGIFHISIPFPLVKNHGIPEEQVQAAIEAGKLFFALPLSEKMELDIKNTPNFKGYTALLQENVDPQGLGDLHEGFDIGREIGVLSSRNDEPGTINGDMNGPNVWPKGLPMFKEPVLIYYDAAVKLGKSLFSLFALALDLPEDFFEDKITKPAAIMRLLHYPPQSPVVRVNDRQMGIGVHTDYECFTILWQDGVGGLQVQNAEGKWIDAVPIPGTLVVNLGDQFARWTNDVFKSTPHRAINRSGKERYSIPLFFGTDYDVPLEPIPTCISPESPAKYEVITAGEYVKSRLDATYA